MSFSTETELTNRPIFTAICKSPVKNPAVQHIALQSSPRIFPEDTVSGQFLLAEQQKAFKQKVVHDQREITDDNAFTEQELYAIKKKNNQRTRKRIWKLKI